MGTDLSLRYVSHLPHAITCIMLMVRVAFCRDALLYPSQTLNSLLCVFLPDFYSNPLIDSNQQHLVE